MMKSSVVKGTCLEMCPKREREWREKGHLLHPFEIQTGTEDSSLPKADKTKTVKQFRRCAAGQVRPEPSDLRPPVVLQNTLHYLIHSVAVREDVPWLAVYEFVADRLKALRQDLTLQQVEGHTAISVLEQEVRFHIYSSYRLCMEPHSTFDPFLNETQLQECLKKLLVLYMEVKADNQTLKCHEEMVALYLLYNLGSPTAMEYALHIPECFRSHSLVSKSYDISKAFIEGNYIKVIRAAVQLPFLLSCCLHSQMEDIRRSMLRVMTVAYSAKNCNFPISVLARWLGFEREEDAKELCSYYGIPVNNSCVHFLKGTFDPRAPTCTRRYEPWLEKERKLLKVSAIIAGKDKCLN